jgi:hypothetical protein
MTIQLAALIAQAGGGTPSILVIFYWVLLLLAAIGAFVPPTAWPYAPRATWVIAIILFVIIGIKMLKPTL